MNVFKDLNDLRHNDNFFYNFFNDMWHFDNSFFSDQNRIHISFDDSINNLKSLLDQVDIVGDLL